MNPIQITLFTHRINAICDEMGEVLKLSSFSPNIKDRLDFSCAIFDQQGGLIAQAAHIPVHLGSMAYSMKDIIHQREWQEGDMLALNNPFKGGTHLPDVTLIAPFFFQKQLIGFVANRAHHADIGADTPGSMPLSQHIDEEGVLIDGQLIVKKHQVQKTVFNHIVCQLSNQQTSQGDFSAQISANQTGLSRLIEFIEQYSINNFKLACKAMNQYAQKIAAQCIKAIPDGEYTFVDVMDDDGFEHKNLTIQVKLSVSNEQVIADFNGTAKQTQGNINCPVSVTAAAIYYVFRCLMPEYIPSCRDTFANIQIKTPKDCFINAQYPAAVVAGNVETSMRIVDVLLGALAQAIPEQIPAASYGTMNNIAMGNYDSHRSWSYYETIAGGHGAGSIGNGLNYSQAHMTNTLNTPIESLENHYPLRIIEYASRVGEYPNSQHKGGDGLIRRFQILENCSATIISERRDYQPWGLNGADAGLAGENYLDNKLLPAKIKLDLKKNQQLTIKTPCGGGWNPASASM